MTRSSDNNQSGRSCTASNWSVSLLRDDLDVDVREELELAADFRHETPQCRSTRFAPAE